MFTDLIVGALKGGAADVRGNVSAASIYAYVEAALGSWDQRPIYKTHASTLPPVRNCQPSVSDDLLRELPKFFGMCNGAIELDPSCEQTHVEADVEKVALFEKFKKLRDARLLSVDSEQDLYYAALNSNSVRLTSLGQFYWKLAKRGLL